MNANTASESSAVFAARGTPRSILRLEALAVGVAALIAYRWLGAGWGRFALLFLVPDLSMLGYLAGPRIGATTYNAVHSYLGALLLAGMGGLLGLQACAPLALIWLAHVGFDRALGYGLKYASDFGDTHLGLIGRRRSPALAR